MARFATEEERIKNALTPTNRDLLNHIRNAEMAAGLKLNWTEREEIIETWTEEVALAVGEWVDKTDEHPNAKEFVYMLLTIAQRLQDQVLQDEKG